MIANLKFKKIVLWLLGIALSSFAIAGLIFITDRTWFKNSPRLSMENVIIAKDYSLESISAINIETISNDISIIPMKTDRIKVTLSGMDSKFRKTSLIITQSNDNINIAVKPKTPEFIPFGFNSSYSLKLKLEVPENYQAGLKVNTISGDTAIQGLGIDSFNYQSISGDLTSSSFKAKAAFLRTTSGDTNLNNFKGDLDYKSISGDFEVIYHNFKNNIKIDTVSGDSKIELPGNSEFNLRFDSVSGDLDSDFPISFENRGGKRSPSGFVGSAKNNIVIHSISGDSEISEI